MKLWLISQEQNNGYDTYDSAVVAAETEAAAQMIIPGSNEYYKWNERHELVRKYPHETAWEKVRNGDWANDLMAVKTEYLGEAKEGTEAGEILASFNAS